MSSNAPRSLHQAWKVTEKRNPFMPKAGTKSTQKRNLNDMIRQNPATPNPSGLNPGIVNFLNKTIKNFMGEAKNETTVNWAAWENNLRGNIARLVREEEQREMAFKRMMHRV